MATSKHDDDVEPQVIEENEEKPKKKVKSGIIYMSRVPTLMNVSIVRRYFERYGEVGRIFLQPNAKASHRGKRGRVFSEGWIEFKDKRLAKQLAATLNNTQIGGKKKNKWNEELWNLKYLHRFQWAHLNERLAYEKAVHSQRMRTEISQAKRQVNFYMAKADRNERQNRFAKKHKGDSEGGSVGDSVVEPGVIDKPYEIKLKDTEEGILRKRKARTGLDDKVTGGKRPKSTESVSKKSFLAKIFSSGLDNDEGAE